MVGERVGPGDAEQDRRGRDHGLDASPLLEHPAGRGQRERERERRDDRDRLAADPRRAEEPEDRAADDAGGGVAEQPEPAALPRGEEPEHGADDDERDQEPVASLRTGLSAEVAGRPDAEDLRPVELVVEVPELGVAGERARVAEPHASRRERRGSRARASCDDECDPAPRLPRRSRRRPSTTATTTAGTSSQTAPAALWTPTVAAAATASGSTRAAARRLQEQRARAPRPATSSIASASSLIPPHSE